MGTTEADALAEALSTEPLFHLSLGSKELFHSNFLGWLAETHPGPTSEALAPWLVEDPTSLILDVRREWKNLDLFLHLPGYLPAVVENKVFSLPDVSQLTRYSLTAPTGATLLLLSLANPGWTDRTLDVAGGYRWTDLTYSELAAALHTQQPAFARQDNFVGQLVGRYVAFARLLVQLGDLVRIVDDDDPVLLPRALFEPLSRVRIQDAAQKLRSRQVLNRLCQLLAAQGLDSHEFKLRSEFSNGTAIISAFVAQLNGDQLGFQLQGIQWRLAIILGQLQGGGPEAKQRRAAYVKDRYGHWFDFNETHKVAGTTEESSRPKQGVDVFNHLELRDFAWRPGGERFSVT